MGTIKKTLAEYIDTFTLVLLSYGKAVVAGADGTTEIGIDRRSL